MLCATFRIQIFFLVAGVKARAFYMFLELNLSSQVLCDCCFKRLSIFFHFRGADAERSVPCDMSTSGPAFWSQLFNLSGALGTICRCCVLCGIAAFVLLEPFLFFGFSAMLENKIGREFLVLAFGVCWNRVPVAGAARNFFFHSWNASWCYSRFDVFKRAF